MLHIEADLDVMTKGQRDALGAFICAYPETPPLTIPNFEDEDETPSIPAFSVMPDEDEDEQSPEEAFTAPAAAAPGPVLVPAPPPPPPPAAPSTDKAGLPWDERIHASSKAVTADGNWRKKRGVTDEAAAQVEAELRAVMGLPGPAVAQVPPPPPVAAAVPPPPPAASIAEGRAQFIALLSKINAGIQGKLITKENVDEAIASVGLPSLPQLGNRLDLVPLVEMYLDALLVGAA